MAKPNNNFHFDIIFRMAKNPLQFWINGSIELKTLDNIFLLTKSFSRSGFWNEQL